MGVCVGFILGSDGHARSDGTHDHLADRLIHSGRLRLSELWTGELGVGLKRLGQVRECTFIAREGGRAHVLCWYFKGSLLSSDLKCDAAIRFELKGVDRRVELGLAHRAADLIGNGAPSAELRIVYPHAS